MKSISKVLSLFLVVVMCFGLFSTSAFATSINIDFDGGNAAGNNNAGGGFNFDSNTTLNSPTNGGGFNFDSSNQDSSLDTFTLDTSTLDTSTLDTSTLDTSLIAPKSITPPMLMTSSSGSASKEAEKDWKFKATPTSITKKDADGTVTITCTNASFFGVNSFPGGYGYSTNSNGQPLNLMTQDQHYSIADTPNQELKIFGSWLKTLEPAVYYFYGVKSDGTRVSLASVSVNLATYGSFSIYNSPYNKTAASPQAITAADVSAFSSFRIDGVTDPSFSQALSYADYSRSNDNTSIAINTDILNNLADGEYSLVGIAPSGVYDTDEKTIGNFKVTTGSLGVSYAVDTAAVGVPYDKSKPQGNDNFVSFRPTGSDAASVAVSEQWLFKFTYKVTSTSGAYSRALQQGVDYTIEKFGNDVYTLALTGAGLNALPDGQYNLVGTGTVGSNTVETVLGTFTVVTSGVNIADFTMHANAYDKSKSDRAEVYAQTKDAATARLMPAASYAISGPQSKTLTKDTEYYVDYSNGLVALKTAFLDTLPDGTYTLTATFTSGATTVQKTLGTFTVSTGNSDSEFTIVNNPYDKSDENRKAVAALAGGNHPLKAVNSVTGVAISGTESRTLASSEYYKVTNNPYYVAIRPEVLDTLPEGTYNLILTVKSGAASTQINAGQFTVKASAVDAEFTIANSPYDKNSTDSKAVGAVPKTTGVIANITGVAISGTESRTLTSSEYYKQPDNGTKPGYVVILKDVLNTLSDGTYNFLVTISTGTSSVQKNAGQFVVKTSPVDFGEFEITGTPFDKNADAPASVVATAKENGKDPVLRNFSIAGVGSMTAPMTLKSSDYTYTEGDASNPRALKLKADFVKTLADGDYYIYAEATSGVASTQGTIGIFTVKTGKIPFGTFTMNPDTYDKNAEKPTEVVATEGSAKDMEKFTGFAITTVGGSFTSTRTLSSSEYAKTDTTVTIKASVLGSLPDGEYKLIGTATVGSTTEQVPIGIFYVKSGDVTFGTYTINPSSFNKNDANRADLSVNRTEKADPRFTPNSFSIAGLTNTSFSRILSVNEYTINDPTTDVKTGWLTLKKNVLDTLPDGNYKLVCTATIGNVSGQVDLGTFTVVSGEVNYGSYAIHKSPYDKNNSSSEAIFSEETHGWGMLQYFNGFAISGVTDTAFNQVLIGSQYTVNDKKTKVTISNDVLNALPDGDYNLLGFATIGQASSQVNMGMFTVTSKYGNFYVYNSPYDKNDKNAQSVYVTGAYADMQKMHGFGVASVSGSYVQALSVNNYYVSGDGKSVVLEESYLDTLADGQYYLIGFPRLGSTKEQVILGTFIVKSGGITGNAMLTPDGQVWYSGSDPLTFYSEIHDLAGKGWNYKPYDWGNIVPDVRYSTYSDMRSPTSVRIDQYWDLNYGYIMLGANFLNSLSAEHTYYLQVVDARDPEGLYSNVVSFRVGPTLRALDTDKHVLNSTRSLRFRSSEPISRVYVGNIELTDPADYGVSWDGRTVTLSFEFLNKRSGGNTYTIKVLTTSGEYASTTFQILTTAQGSASPRTGDESNLGLWAAFLLLSGTAVVILLPKLKKQNF